MEIGQYIHVLRAHRALVVLSVLLCTAGAGALAWTVTPTYAAKTQLYVSAQGRPGEGKKAYEGGLYAQQRARSYAEIISSPRGALAAIEQLGLDESVESVQDKIRASVPPNSVLINVTATDQSPERAEAIANSLQARLTVLAEELETPEGRERSPVQITVTAPARLPTDPVSPQKPIYLALGALFGLAVGVGGAVLRHTQDRRIRSDADATVTAGAPSSAGLPSTGIRRCRPSCWPIRSPAGPRGIAGCGRTSVRSAPARTPVLRRVQRGGSGGQDRGRRQPRHCLGAGGRTRGGRRREPALAQAW